MIVHKQGNKRANSTREHHQQPTPRLSTYGPTASASCSAAAAVCSFWVPRANASALRLACNEAVQSSGGKVNLGSSPKHWSNMARPQPGCMGHTCMVQLPRPHLGATRMHGTHMHGTTASSSPRPPCPPAPGRHRPAQPGGRQRRRTCGPPGPPWCAVHPPAQRPGPAQQQG